MLRYSSLAESRDIPHQSTTSAQRGALPPKTSPLPHLRVTTKPMLPLLPRSRHPCRLSLLGRCPRDTARSLLSMSSRRPIQATPQTTSLSLSIPRTPKRSPLHLSRRLLVPRDFAPNQKSTLLDVASEVFARRVIFATRRECDRQEQQFNVKPIKRKMLGVTQLVFSLYRKPLSTNLNHAYCGRLS